MTIRNRDTQTLGCDQRAVSADDLAVFNLAPYLQRFFFRFFFFTADVGDNIIQNFRPAFKGLAGAGNCLISAGQNVFDAIFAKRRECRDIALDGAV